MMNRAGQTSCFGFMHLLDTTFVLLAVLAVSISLVAGDLVMAGEREVRAISGFFPNDAIAVQRIVADNAVTMARRRFNSSMRERRLEENLEIKQRVRDFEKQHASEIEAFRKAFPRSNIALPSHLIEPMINILQIAGQDAEDYRIMVRANEDDYKENWFRQDPVFYFLVERDHDWLTFVPSDQSILKHRDQGIAWLAHSLSTLRISSTTAGVEFMGVTLDEPSWEVHPDPEGSEFQFKGLTWGNRHSASFPLADFVINGHKPEGGTRQRLFISLSYSTRLGFFFGSFLKNVSSRSATQMVSSSWLDYCEDGSAVIFTSHGEKSESEVHSFLFKSIPRSQIPAASR